MLLFILVSVVLNLCECKNINSKEIGIKLGDKIEACCTLKAEGENALSLWWGAVRITTLFQNKLIEGDFETFVKTHKDYKTTTKDETICVTKDQSTKSDQSLTYKCVKIKGMFGQTLDSEEFSIKIFEDLKFLIKPDEVKNVSSGDTFTVECVASGSPDLKVIWRKEDRGVIISGNDSATLDLKDVTPAMNGNKYICEASISFPKDSPNSMITQTTTLNVLFAPKIQVDILSFHTDLGIKEVVKIIVKGNPQPKLDCQLLNIAADRVISISQPSPFSYMYHMEFDNVTKEHIKNYACTASNSQGKLEKTISFVLGPTNLRIISPNSTDYCNYYSLMWSVDSKAKMNTSRINIEVYEDGLDSSSEKRVLEGQDLNPKIVSAGNEENSWRYQYSQDLMNLTSNKLHKISLQMCSRHQCIDDEYPVYVRTPLSDGKNVMVASQLYSNQDTGGGNPGVSMMRVTPFVVLAVTAVSVILDTHLH